MKNLFYILVLSCFLFSCASKNKVVTLDSVSSQVSKKDDRYSGGDGTSFKKAIIIKASNSNDGIRAEYEYLDEKYGRRGFGYQVVSQALSYNNKKPYDVLTIKVKGKEMKYYFDISSFFGKW